MLNVTIPWYTMVCHAKMWPFHGILWYAMLNVTIPRYTMVCILNVTIPWYTMVCLAKYDYSMVYYGMPC